MKKLLLISALVFSCSVCFGGQEVTYVNTASPSGTQNGITRAITAQLNIDNAAAVNKGGGLVGIPVTAHGIPAVSSGTTKTNILIAGTVNYNGAYEIESVTDDEIVITETFAVETFNVGTETLDNQDRAYSSLQQWETAEQKDLVAVGNVHTVHCAGPTGVADGTCTVAGWTTNSGRYIVINTERSWGARNRGVYPTDNRYTMEVSGTDGLIIQEEYVRVQGVSFQYTGASVDSKYGININTIGASNDIRISGCVFKGVLSGTSDNNAAIAVNDADAVVRAHNNVIFDYFITGNTNNGILSLDCTTLNAYNNTIYGCNNGVNETGAGTITVKNCAILGNDDDFAGTITADTNASDDGDGTNSISPADWDLVFEDVTNRDFHLLLNDTQLKDAGLDDPSSGIYDTDIDDDERMGANDDIGADEGVEAARLGWIGDTNVHEQGATPTLPAAGSTYIDTVYGTEVLRVTDRVNGHATLNVHNYASDGSSFNCDSTRFVILQGTSSGHAKLYAFSPSTMSFTPGAETTVQFNHTLEWTFIQWDRDDPDILYGIEANTKNLYQLDVSVASVGSETGYTLLKDFGTVTALDDAFADLAAAPGGDENLSYLQVSADDNIFAFLVGKVDGHSGNQNNLGVVAAWNRTTDTTTVVDMDALYGERYLHAVLLDKAGDYLLFSPGEGNDKWFWNINANTVEEVINSSTTRVDGHRCMGTHTMHVVDGAYDRLVMIKKDLVTGAQTYTKTFDPLLLHGEDWTQGQHSSMHHANESWLLLSHYHGANDRDVHATHDLAYQNEIFLAYTDRGSTVQTIRFLHHRSEPHDITWQADVLGTIGAASYWASPRASSSLDGQFVIWTGNWEATQNAIDVFIARIPQLPQHKCSPTGGSGTMN